MSGHDSGQDEGGYGDAGSGYDSGTSDFGESSEPDFGAGDYLASELAKSEYSVPSSFPSDDKFYGADPSGARKPGESNKLGFFATIGNFLSKTISHIAKNPGTFLMNTAVNLTPVGAFANIASGLTTGSSIGTNISNTVGKNLGFDPVAPSAFNQALGDVGKGVLSGIPAGFDLSSYLSATPTQTPTTVSARSVATPSINDPFGAGNNIYDTEIVPKSIY